MVKEELEIIQRLGILEVASVLLYVCGGNIIIICLELVCVIIVSYSECGEQ